MVHGEEQRVDETKPGGAMALITPCKNICKLDGKWCLGCKRHTDEIGEWFFLSEEQAAEIMAELPTRRLPPPDERSG